MVISKEPVVGRVKTRMCPPLTHEAAAELAAASLADTFAAVGLADVDQRVAIFEGDPQSVVPSGWLVIPQRTGGLDVRLADAFQDVIDVANDANDCGAVLIAMDTPQVSSSMLDFALDELQTHDAVLGLTDDGGYWIVGLRAARRDVFEGVPMSQANTGAEQLKRLRSLGLSVAVLDQLRDLDTVDDVAAVSAEFPDLQVSSWWRAAQFQVVGRTA